MLEPTPDGTAAPAERALVWLHDNESSFEHHPEINGWTIVEVGYVPEQDRYAAEVIHYALKEWSARQPSLLRAVLAAEGTAVPVALRAIAQLRERDEIVPVRGLVALDGVPDDAAQAGLSSLAELADVATILAARAGLTDIRRRGLALHRRLQAAGRDTCFIVVPNERRSLIKRLADPRDPLGMEMRRLLDPVHSRSE